MAMSIYVGNLPFSATEADIRDLFTPYGAVEKVNVILDRETGRPRGFAFVEMDADSGKAAIEALEGAQFGGRQLKVNEAAPRESRPRRF